MTLEKSQSIISSLERACMRNDIHELYEMKEAYSADLLFILSCPLYIGEHELFFVEFVHILSIVLEAERLGRSATWLD